MPRNYTITPEARRQRSEAAKARWAAMSGVERTEAMRPAFSITPGNPTPGKKGWTNAPRSKSGKFLPKTK